MASKLKRRRGAKNKGGAFSTFKIVFCVGILLIAVVMVTLMSGMRDALQRQRDKLLIHKETKESLTRPSDVNNEEAHQKVLRKNAEILKERVEAQAHIGDHKQPVRLAGGGRDPVIPEVKMPPPEQLGGPYPYPLEAPPEGYDVHASYEPLGGFRFGEYTTGEAPYQITDEIRDKSDEVARKRRDYVKAMMQFAWKGYVDHAFGQDEIKPSSGRGDNNWGGLGIQLVDCLDTLWLVGMKDEFWQARDWVRDHLNHNVGRAVSVFETTIRSLGGLLAAYDWSGDQAFLDQALDLGKRLGHAFDNSNTGLPFGQVNLGSGRSNNIGWARGNVILSEFGSMQLEFRMLDQSAKTPETAELRRKNEHVFEIMNQISPRNGLFPYYLSNNDPSGQPRFKNDHLTFGAMADSFYEYMLKVWLQGGKTEPLYREMYDKAMQGMHDELLQTSKPSGLVYIADKIGASRYDYKMDHLVCFMGGLLALGAYTDPLGLDSPRAQRDLKTGRVCIGLTLFLLCFCAGRVSLIPFLVFTYVSPPYQLPKGIDLHLLPNVRTHGNWYCRRICAISRRRGFQNWIGSSPLPPAS